MYWDLILSDYFRSVTGLNENLNTYTGIHSTRHPCLPVQPR